MSSATYPILHKAKIDGFKNRKQLIKIISELDNFTEIRSVYLEHVFKKYLESNSFSFPLHMDTKTLDIKEANVQRIFLSLRVHKKGEKWQEYTNLPSQKKDEIDKSLKRCLSKIDNIEKSKTPPYEKVGMIINELKKWKDDLNKNNFFGESTLKFDGETFKQTMNILLHKHLLIDIQNYPKNIPLITQSPSEIHKEITTKIKKIGRDDTFVQEVWGTESMYEMQDKVLIKKDEIEQQQKIKKDVLSKDIGSVLLSSPLMGSFTHSIKNETKLNGLKLFDKIHRQSMAEDFYILKSTSETFEKEKFIQMLESGTFTEQQIMHGRGQAWQRNGISQKTNPDDALSKEIEPFIKQECKKLYKQICEYAWGNLDSTLIHNRIGLIGISERETKEFFKDVSKANYELMFSLKEYLPNWKEIVNEIYPEMSQMIAFMETSFDPQTDIEKYELISNWIQMKEDPIEEIDMSSLDMSFDL